MPRAPRGSGSRHVPAQSARTRVSKLASLAPSGPGGRPSQPRSDESRQLFYHAESRAEIADRPPWRFSKEEALDHRQAPLPSQIVIHGRRSLAICVVQRVGVARKCVLAHPTIQRGPNAIVWVRRGRFGKIQLTIALVCRIIPALEHPAGSAAREAAHEESPIRPIDSGEDRLRVRYRASQLVAQVL